MSKKLYTAAIATLVTVGIFVGVNKRISSQELTELQIANIEALAEGEIIGDKIPCHSESKWNIKKAYVDCASCIRIEGWERQGTEAKCTR